MDIKVSDLKKFKTLSSHIKGNGVLPIHDYLKFGKGVIQKEVTSAFIKYECKDAKEELLIDEKALYELVNVTASEIISIVRKGDKVIISDGVDKITIQTPAVSLFVDIAIVGHDKIDISDDFLEAIGCAAQVCDSMKSIPDKYMYVMIGNKCVTGISVAYGFCRLIDEDVTMSLEKKVASFISKTNANSCSVSESHYIFYTNEATIGFAKQEIGYGDFGAALRRDPGELTFVASSRDISSFNSLCQSLFTNPVVTMKKGMLEVEDSLKDISQNRAVPVTPYEEFPYLPGQMNMILSAMGSEELDFYQKGNMMLIKSNETRSTAAVGKINKN